MTQALRRWEGIMTLWEQLEGRYAVEKPVRRLLALDGGGIRGVITLEILAQLEAELRGKLGRGPDFRLGDYFDYVAGTSTGAIIAAGIALGMSVAELSAFYRESGPLMFQKEFILQRMKQLYSSEPLQLKLQTAFGAETDLSLKFYRCLLLVVTRNSSTDSAWPITNNPYAKYNARSRADCNLNIPLWKLVRASTAAPIYFPPEVLRWDKDDPGRTFLFQDGGVTPYNNPAFLLYRKATLKPYQLGWPSGEDRMLLMSIGTGTAPAIDGDVLHPDRTHFSTLVDLPGALMSGAKVDQDIICRTVGRCVSGPEIDRELGDLIPVDAAGRRIPLSEPLGRAFVYARYEVDLTRLDQLGLAKIDAARAQRLDAVDAIDDLSAIGKQYALRHVDLTQFGNLLTP
jgi:uncharacterized protein